MEENKDNVYDNYIKSNQEEVKEIVTNLCDNSYDLYIQHSQSDELNDEENIDDNIYDFLLQSDKEIKGKSRK